MIYKHQPYPGKGILRIRSIPLFVLIFPVLMFICNYSSCQDKKAREDFLNAEYYLNQQEYDDAMVFYLRLLEQDTTNSFVNYRIGQCYFYIREKYDLAFPYLQKAAGNVASGKNKAGFTSGSAPPDVYYLLGELYQRNYMFDEALQAFLDYKEHVSDAKDPALIEKANVKIQSLAIARALIENPVAMKVQNLGPNINTRFSDYNPVVSVDEKKLVYTSFWESADRIFQSEYKNGNWSVARDISPELGSDGTFYTTGISADGKDLYLVKLNDYNCNIYFSHYNDTSWTPLVSLNGRINSASHETSASVSADGQYLYFSSDRTGNFDIYRSEKVNGDWDKPENLGSIINTPFDEISPYITADNKNLFFSSDGHRTMGGMDIFFSTFLEDGTWSKPQNLGYPINTTSDDIFYVPVNNGDAAYYSKYSAEGKGRNDIFRIEFPFETKYAESMEEQKEKQEVDDELATYKKNSASWSDSFCIQIIAVQRYIDPKYFNEFGKLRIILGSDGLYRYLIDSYANLLQSTELLEKVRKLGYPDAFVRTIRSIPGYGNEE